MLGSGGLFMLESFWLLGENCFISMQKEEVKQWFSNFREHNHRVGRVAPEVYEASPWVGLSISISSRGCWRQWSKKHTFRKAKVKKKKFPFGERFIQWIPLMEAVILKYGPSTASASPENLLETPIQTYCVRNSGGGAQPAALQQSSRWFSCKLMHKTCWIREAKCCCRIPYHWFSRVAACWNYLGRFKHWVTCPEILTELIWSVGWVQELF